MSYDQLQKRLIPVNIAVMIISLVAALSLLFAPLLSVDVGQATEALLDLAKSPGGNILEESPLENETFTGIIKKGTDGMVIKITAVGLAKFASSEDPAGQITEFVGNAFSKIEGDLFSVVAVTFIPQLAEKYDAAAVDMDRVDVDKLTEKLNAVFDAGSEAQTDEAISVFVDELQAQAVTSAGSAVIQDGMKEPIKDYIKKFYSDAKNEVDGDVTLENFVCVTVSEFMNGEVGNNGGTDGGTDGETDGQESPQDGGNAENDGKIYTRYEELLSGMFGETESSDSASDLNDSLKTFMPYLKYIAYAVFGFAAIWLILFLFAFIHLFLGNRKFTMWYVKLTGAFPCIIFYLIPLSVKSFFSSLVGTLATLSAVLAAVSSMAWISGVCYLLLWAVSIFWAHPIKRQIRKL